MGREEIIGSPSFNQISDLGVVQFKNDYDSDLLSLILRRAIELKDQHAEARQLDLKYIRRAHEFIPEILDLAYCPARLARLTAFAGTRVEPYPLSVIASIITFSGPAETDSTIKWHADGVPATELVPLAMENLIGGELEIFRGPAEVGLARQARGMEFLQDETIRVQHKLGYSVLGQLMRLMHRVTPITSGYRITLNMNVRSAERPYIDDNSMCYLAADNPDFAWTDEYTKDVQERQLPAYLRHQAG